MLAQGRRHVAALFFVSAMIHPPARRTHRPGTPAVGDALTSPGD